MLKLIKPLLYRIKNNKAFLITYAVLIPIVISIAVYVTNNVSYQMRVGIVGDIEVVEKEGVEYVFLEEQPLNSTLVLNTYDAIVTQENKVLSVHSTKNEEFNQVVLLLMQGDIDTLPEDTTQRGAASNIIGFLMMVIGLLGTQMYNFYFDERNGINKRIMSTSTRCSQYVLSHFVVVLGFLFIPSVIAIISAIFVFDITLAMSVGQFILILFLLCFFCASFGLWINVISKTLEESIQFGNMFAIIGSIVSGGFAQVTNNKIFDTIVQVFPQKQIMSLLSALENQHSLPYMGILYIIILSFVLLLLGMMIEKKKLPHR